MKAAYFDCFSGISGDMILGSLLDSGLHIDTLQDTINALNIGNVKISAKKVLRAGLTGTKIDLQIESEDNKLGYNDIVSTFNASSLDGQVKKQSIEIFNNIASAEEKVHNTKKEKLHFHEMAGKDLLIDISCAVAGLNALEIEQVFASPVNLGSGFISSPGHGRIPIPGPAVTQMVKGRQVYSAHVEKELATPTGVGIITTLTSCFEPLMPITINSVGYGAGNNNNTQLPNLLRLFLGEVDQTTLLSDNVTIIETNIDDMNPQVFEYIFEKLFKADALDAYLVPIIMKKGRPAFILTVITEKEKQQEIEKIIFTETTSIGIRYHYVPRKKLNRKNITITTTYGEISCKAVQSWDGESTKVLPEYEECKKIANKTGIALNLVFKNLLHELSKVKIEK